MLWNIPSLDCEYVLFSLVALQDEQTGDPETEHTWQKLKSREMQTSADEGEQILNELTNHEPFGIVQSEIWIILNVIVNW